MKKLAFAALLCGGLAQLATGCVIKSADGTGIAASWNLVGGDDNIDVDCPPGATTVEIVTQDINGMIVDKFDCLGAATVTVDRDPGIYDTWVRVTGDSPADLRAQSLSLSVTVQEGNDTPAGFDISVDRGSFYFDWEIAYAGEPSSCDDAATPYVAVTSTWLDDANVFYDDEQPCTAGTLTTRGMILGTYQLSVALLDDLREPIYTAPSETHSLDYGNHFNYLDVFVLDGAGN